MSPHPTQTKRRLTLLPTLVLCGTLFLLYKIFRSPDLDKQIDKLSARLQKGI
jgi:hypothetical protein